MILFSCHLTSQHHLSNLDFVSGCRGIQYSSQKEANKVLEDQTYQSEYS